MGTLLALASSVCYGIADYAGGLLSRRTSPAAVALVGQLGGLVLMAVAAVLLPGRPLAADLGWGALSGAGTGVGMLLLYRALARGAMSVAVPVSAVGGLAIPVLFGLALFGERPSALSGLGMALAVPALFLLARDGRPAELASSGTVDALVAGVGIAVQYLALARAQPDAGMWPVAAGRLAAALLIAPLLLRAADRWMPAPRLAAAAATGCCAALALVAYLLATREQLVTVAVVLSSLYPVLPVLLGLTVLGERLTAPQRFGLLTAGVATVLLAAG
ncbi:DMT family transporter [Pseudonocardia eucalypti]|uniref:DMT family transporter n=1 Tax=Pseudonocardia eucalypti TaxID=648755 RepID=A0ABP9PJL7_9PSEU|nr:drug/metabolite transporter (DMT)-like permease [Pseudonocardia eucalypti]